MLTNSQVQSITCVIHSIPELKGVPVGHYTHNQCRVIHNGSQTINGFVGSVIIEEVPSISLATGSDGMGVTNPSPAIGASTLNGSRLGKEMGGAALKCGMTVLSFIGASGATLATVKTGGLAGVLAVVAWSGVATSSTQCLNGLVRSSEAIRNPDGNTLHEWDQQEAYQSIMRIVEGIGVIGGIVSLPSATRNLLQVMRQRNLFRVSPEELVAMNRHQRSQVIREATAKAAGDPQSARALDEALSKANIASKTLARNSLSVRNAKRASQVIHQHVKERLKISIASILSSAYSSHTAPSFITPAKNSSQESSPMTPIQQNPSKLNDIIIHIVPFED